MSEDVVPLFHHDGSFVRDNKGDLVNINRNVKRFSRWTSTSFASLTYRNFFWSWDNMTTKLCAGMISLCSLGIWSTPYSCG
ncbi:uncharacterized protein DS421_9g274340 [Arachis hypogaea]|nr:uncharacterized protein DS421_9g274340 [Arachis hypogaea]